jgi:hypothetical protein
MARRWLIPTAGAIAESGVLPYLAEQNGLAAS